MDLEEIKINRKHVSRIISEYEKDDPRCEGDAQEKIRRSLIRTDEYINKFLTHLNPENKSHGFGIIPPHCRFMKSYKTGVNVVVIEEEPAMRSIRVSMDMSRAAEELKARGEWEKFGYEKFFEENRKPYTFMVAVPYVIHVLQMSGSYFSRGKVFFRPKPLMGLSDPLFKPPLLNINSSMNVCYGDEASRGPKTSIHAESEHAIKVFWSAVFNPDYIDNYHAYSSVAGLCDYFTWQYYSQTNPMFIYTADWIPTSGHNATLGSVIDRITASQEKQDSSTRRYIGFQTLLDMFEKPQISDKNVKVGSFGGVRPLMYDVCNTTVLDDGLVVCVGDPLKYSKDRIAYVDSFAGVKGTGTPTHIRLNIDENLRLLRLRPKTRLFITEAVKQLRYEQFIELPDKTKFESGDIISMENKFGNEVFKKIYYIRKAPDERIEMRVGSEFWFIDAIDWTKVKKFDTTNPEVDGIKLEKGKEYAYFSHSYYPPTPISYFKVMKYHEITTNDNNSLVCKFMSDTGSSAIPLSSARPRPKKIYELSELEDLPQSFFLGRRLMQYYEGGRKAGVNGHKEFGILYKSGSGSLLMRDLIFRDIKESFLNEDGTKFHAESYNLKIDFEIGDRVVIANWTEPLDVLKVKTIQGFVVNSNHGTIDFTLQDKHGNLSSITYVDSETGIINVGKIRKVTNELNGVTTGTKIVAKETGIACFPKKDVNIIVAFIIDTDGEPLALCSNGCTLWFSDLMEKFDHIKKSDPQWSKLQHAPLDPKKIKLQPGDIVRSNSRTYNRDRYGYLVTRTGVSPGLKFSQLAYYHEFDEYREPRKTFVASLYLDCIPNPRLTVPQQNRKGLLNAFPTFHGGISPTNIRHSPYKLIDETGRF